MISPDALVTVIAAPNERQGWSSEQLMTVLASAPLGETKVRCADACTAVVAEAKASAAATCSRYCIRRLRLRG